MNVKKKGCRVTVDDRKCGEIMWDKGRKEL
jgi:hypothetical protein